MDQQTKGLLDTQLSDCGGVEFNGVSLHIRSCVKSRPLGRLGAWLLKTAWKLLRIRVDHAIEVEMRAEPVPRPIDAWARSTN